MTVRTLVVDGVTVPVWASLDIRQELEPLEGAASGRLRDGAAYKRKRWGGKRRTVITGGGNAPSGLQAIDTDTSFEIWCIVPVAINSATAGPITLPTARRSDAGSEPHGFAIVDGAMVPTTCNVVGDDATLGAVSGASSYQVRYFPVLTVIGGPVEEDLQRATGFGWQLTAEEV